MSQRAPKNPVTAFPPGGGLIVALICALAGQAALAGPGGLSVAQGNVSATQNGSQLQITASHNAVINWQSFNIRAGETTTFVQPSSVSVVWNRILDANPSQIWGTLNANGIVVLMNQNGFYFGPNSMINVGGLVVTTAVPPPNFSPGPFWQFDGSPPLASIVNYGEIKAHSGGSIFLLSERIENHGTISAPGGEVRLEAGKEVLISERPDGRGLSATVRLPEGSVDNNGKIIADAGTVALHAQTVNQNGLVQADSIREHNGVIELVASESINLGEGSSLSAKGDPAAPSPGGNITIKSAGSFSDVPSSRIDVSGGVQGGDGGTVEISATKMSSINSTVVGSAAAGSVGGKLLLDPVNIELTSADVTGTTDNGNVHAGDPGDTLQLNVNSAFVGFSSISLEAQQNITLKNGTTWDLNASTGIGDAGSKLMLEAGNSIVFEDNSHLVSGGGWSVGLKAGVNFSDSGHPVRSGIGGIYLNGGVGSLDSGSIEMAEGSINLQAGHEILLGSGYVRTSQGGSISLQTGDGDVDAGNNGLWYKFVPRAGVQLDTPGPGGITTTAGGDVSIDAGGDIKSNGGIIGALGKDRGDVTIHAGHQVSGTYMLRNGNGLITAGVNHPSGNNVLDPSEITFADGSVGGTKPINLGLITGSWRVFAANNIIIDEVFNPNGALNSDKRGPLDNTRLQSLPRVSYEYDYADDASVSLTAGNGVQLLGTGRIRAGNLQELTDATLVYPPQLEIHAGRGGVEIGKENDPGGRDIVLFPSGLGRLEITTTDGGSLRSSSILVDDVTSATPGATIAAAKFYNITMSDSDLPASSFASEYNNLTTRHAPIPLHLNSAMEKVTLDISGNIEDLALNVPKQAKITVGGDVKNFAFKGQGLTPPDGYWNFVIGDISDLGSFAQQLRAQTDDATKFVWANLSPETQNLVNNYDPIMSNPRALNLALTKDLNKIVQGVVIYDEEVFPMLSPDTMLLHGAAVNYQNAHGSLSKELSTQLNRLVLGDTFATLSKIPVADLTEINIGGDLTIRSSHTSVTLHDDANIAVLDPLFTADANLVRPFTYDSVSRVLDLQNRMTAEELNFLLHPQIRAVDAAGNFLTDNDGNPIFADSFFSGDRAALNNLFVRSQEVPNSLAQNGFQIGGPGRFQLSARNVDLGISGGIRSRGPQDNPYLASSVSPFGASIKLSLGQNLELISSQIATFNGGDIMIDAGGDINVGSQQQFTSDDTPKGIYTAHGGNVTVTAFGNIEVNGSRIASYDGGDVFVQSVNGFVDAGAGAKGFFFVPRTKPDGNIGQDRFFGSGILALVTDPESSATVGDITVKTKTDIIANAGGILQLAFNGHQGAGKVTLDAGHDIIAGQSGVLGGDVSLTAGGNVKGLVVAQRSININAGQNVGVTAVSGGSVTVKAESASGSTLVGTTAVSASGDVSGASLISSSGQTSTSGSGQASQGAFANVTAPTAVKTSEDAATTVAMKKNEEEEDPLKKKKPVLAKTTGRVTVILPTK